MPVYKKRPDFFTSEEGLLTQETLRAMMTDVNYHTDSSYSANTALHSDNLVSFVDKHMSYLRDHPSTDPRQYLSNLRLMTRIRSSSSLH